jgi:hypothetical protein
MLAKLGRAEVEKSDKKISSIHYSDLLLPNFVMPYSGWPSRSIILPDKMSTKKDGAG